MLHVSLIELTLFIYIFYRILMLVNMNVINKERQHRKEFISIDVKQEEHYLRHPTLDTLKYLILFDGRLPLSIEHGKVLRKMLFRFFNT